MLPLSGACYSPVSMTCGGPACASARITSVATSPSCSTPRAPAARPASHTATSALSSQTQQTTSLSHPHDGPPAMLPSRLLQLRLGVLSRGTASRLRTPIQPPSSNRSLHHPLAPAAAATGTSGPTAPAWGSAACIIGSSPLGSSPTSLPLSHPASTPSPASSMCLFGGRHRHLTTHIHAAGPAGGSGSAPGADGKRKQQPQSQSKQKQKGGQRDGWDAGGAGVATPPVPASPPAGVRYSPLHYNIEDFATRVVPTEGERRQRMEVIDAVRSSVQRVFPASRHVELQTFGSFANGLSTWQSDIDLVVTGLGAPDRLTGGYEPHDRAKVTSRLRKISDALQRGRDIDILRQQLIPRARIPILKLWTKNRVCVDVSVSDDSGPRAARYLTQQCRAYPPLKPLVLVLKSYLKSCRLNEVNTGGLSSYSLTNMVIAHLQEELKAGHDISDLGETLYTFLLRYGEEHDYGNQAVSVASGGVVPKMSLGFAMESARQAALSQGAYEGAVSWSERLYVDCPLTGRDVSNGTYRIDLVRGAFVKAARNLEALARGRRITDTSLNYLQALFDVNRVLKRFFDPYEPQEDEYLKALAGKGGGLEEDDDLDVGLVSEDEEEDDGLAGDYLEPRSTIPTQQRRR